jgi:hypothetical protein
MPCLQDQVSLSSVSHQRLAQTGNYITIGMMLSSNTATPCASHWCTACHRSLSLPTAPCRYHGCCCSECQNAPRLLRPIKIDGGNYGNWGNYADIDSLSPVMAKGRSRKYFSSSMLLATSY